MWDDELIESSERFSAWSHNFNNTYSNYYMEVNKKEAKHHAIYMHELAYPNLHKKCDLDYAMKCAFAWKDGYMKKHAERYLDWITERAKQRKAEEPLTPYESICNE